MLGKLKSDGLEVTRPEVLLLNRYAMGFTRHFKL